MLIKNTLIENSKPKSFTVLSAENYCEALIRDSSVLYSFRGGRKIAENAAHSGKALF